MLEPSAKCDTRDYKKQLPDTPSHSPTNMTTKCVAHSFLHTLCAWLCFKARFSFKLLASLVVGWRIGGLFPSLLPVYKMFGKWCWPYFKPLSQGVWGGGSLVSSLLPKVFGWWMALFQAFGLALFQASQLLCWASMSFLSSTSFAFVMPCFSQCGNRASMTAWCPPGKLAACF